jgi:hypothetical protein
LFYSWVNSFRRLKECREEAWSIYPTPFRASDLRLVTRAKPI